MKTKVLSRLLETATGITITWTEEPYQGKPLKRTWVSPINPQNPGWSEGDDKCSMDQEIEELLSEGWSLEEQQKN